MKASRASSSILTILSHAHILPLPVWPSYDIARDVIFARPYRRHASLYLRVALYEYSYGHVTTCRRPAAHRLYSDWLNLSRTVPPSTKSTLRRHKNIVHYCTGLLLRYTLNSGQTETELNIIDRFFIIVLFTRLLLQ